MSDVTQLLGAAAAGDRRAAAELLPLVYDELRKLAAARMAAEAPGHTLDATALVHEAYLRLVGDQQFDGCGHFFAAAAEAMRRILVDHARRRLAAKRGAGRRASVDLDQLSRTDADQDVLAVHDSLDRLAAVEPKVANLVMPAILRRSNPPRGGRRPGDRHANRRRLVGLCAGLAGRRLGPWVKKFPESTARFTRVFRIGRQVVQQQGVLTPRE